ncbi:HNH endonuclease signature motif containing protein [Aspergillus fischeri NRRL 181]|uniref:HNH nuclease domain-containing protein n=1 Tax=Neosartorya fischeri (strain ATCC 1020 / DSM 3700 / CBS 544.65 / FGSC A1164 / JCM 1740 / NRRL 181 / WB 181) TaxID=331117 RepID=A1DFT1_NEOFI|nr:uncharacterized protein NFIA_081840 [Aspergillus fischeri NRRL 181]EAW18238.1 hypothetical protein NFIA_081840 [Aspergillus fischeri NRRL 181]
MLAQYKPRNTRDETVRILRSFIDNLPVKSKRVLTKYINVSNDDNLFDLAHHLQTAILIPSTYIILYPLFFSPLSATDNTRDNVASEMTQSSTRRNHLEWLKKTCLERDNYQCVVTKLWDPIAEPIFNLQEQGKMTANTRLVHIIPFSMGCWDNDWKAKEIAQSWETLYLLFPDIQEIIKPITINSPANAMTMNTVVHEDFGSFKIALIPTDTDSTYRIKTYPLHQTLVDQFYEKPITFTTHSGSELPSKVLLETHAVIAEILHASGQGEEKIDELLRKWDDIGCLASDGSTDLESLLLLVSQ